MHVQDEVGAGVERHAMSSGSGSGGVPGLPEEEMAVRLEAIGDDLQVHARKAHGGVARRRAGGPRRCDRPARWRDARSVRCPGGSRSLARNRSSVEWHGQDEVVKQIVAVRIEQGAGAVAVSTRSGMPSCHEEGKMARRADRRRRLRARLSPRPPASQSRRQPPLADEVAMALDRRPGRH